MNRALAGVVIVWAAACAPKVPARATVSLRMTGAPSDARVVIDDQYVGPLGAVTLRGRALPAGEPTISVGRQGPVPCDQLATVKAGDPPLRLACPLTPLPE